MTRRFLITLYRISGVLGAASLLLLAAVVLAQIVGRLVRVQIEGADEFTAWLMAAGAFFSLAYTFRHGAHIRVGLLLERIRGRGRRLLEIACLAAAALITGMFTWAAFDLVYSSWRYSDISGGLIRMPMWIPQLSMAAGALLLAIAVLDDLLMITLGRRASYDRDSGARVVEQTSGEL